MHGELGSSRIEENPHAATWGAGPLQEVIPQVGEMSLRAGGMLGPDFRGINSQKWSLCSPAPGLLLADEAPT